MKGPKNYPIHQLKSKFGHVPVVDQVFHSIMQQVRLSMNCAYHLIHQTVVPPSHTDRPLDLGHMPHVDCYISLPFSSGPYNLFYHCCTQLEAEDIDFRLIIEW